MDVGRNMAGKKPKLHNQKRSPRNYVRKQMILDKIGQSFFMKDRRDKRAFEHEKDWEKEDWGE
jgi:hypothetical protein